jgi:hypothetical protein
MGIRFNNGLQQQYDHRQQTVRHPGRATNGMRAGVHGQFLSEVYDGSTTRGGRLCRFSQGGILEGSGGMACGEEGKWRDMLRFGGE